MPDDLQDLPPDPTERTTYTLRATNQDGTVHETELTAAQALDLGAGKAIAYTVREEQIAVEEDGTIVERDSAVPPEAAA